MNRYFKAIASATLASSVLMGASAPAMAGGDLAPLPPERCSGGPFEGPYIGATVGWVSNDSEQTSLNNGARLSSDGDGWAVGALAGYNRQCGRLVYGIEADISWTDVDSSNTLAGQTFSTSYDYFGTVRGRLGLAHENILFYITGGLAYASVDHVLNAPAFGISQSDSDVNWGYTIGGGIEFNRGHWSLRAEALYVDIGDETVSYTGSPTGCGGVCRADVKWDDDFVVARLGLTFKLHREEPRHEPLK